MLRRLFGAFRGLVHTFLLLGAAGAAAAAEAAEVNVYSARQEALIRPLLDRFTEQTGIEVNLVSGKADPLIKRLEAEGMASPADLLLTVDVARLVRAEQAGLLQPLRSASLEQAIPATYRHPDGQWFGLSLRSRVIVYAPDRVDPAELSGYADLADPRWRGRVCVRSSNNTYNQSLVAGLIAHEGAEAAEQWARGLVANFARPPRGGDRDQIMAVAAGQCDLALVNTYYLAGMLGSTDAAQREAAGQVAVFWPDQAGTGAHINVSGAGITRAARNPENAARLIEFMASPEAQRWYAEVNHEYPVIDGVAIDRTLTDFGDFRADTLPLAELGEHTGEAIEVMDRAGWK